MSSQQMQINTNTAAFKIFNQLFKVIMPVMQVRTIEDIQQRGVVISGDRRYDEAMRAERRLYYQTIAQLVEFHRRGVAIRLVEPKDSVVIYELVQQHLEDWAGTLKFSFNVRVDQEVVDDLIAMDEFATAVYPRAQHNSDHTAHIPTFAQEFLGYRKQGKGNALGISLSRAPQVGKGQESNTVAEVGPIPPRESLGGVFKQRKIQFDPIFNKPRDER